MGTRAKAILSLAFVTFGTWTCKNRPGVSETASAEPAEPAGCESLGAGGAISANKLIQRAANPACKAKFLPLPLVRQTKGFTCGAASLQSILFYYGDFYPEGILQRILKTHKENGTSFRRIMKFVTNLNDPRSREAFDKVSGFDEAMELSDLRAVLANADVQAALKKHGTKPEFKSVLEGLKRLADEDVDLDKLPGGQAAGAGLALTGASDVIDHGHRVQPDRPADAAPGKYSVELYVDQQPFNGGEGGGTDGCPSETPPTASSSAPLQHNGMTIEQLEKAIDNGTPVLALTQAWTFSSDADYDVNEYAKAWYSGHYVAIIGYDPKNIYYMDPYNMGHYTFLPREDWLKRWHDYDGWLSKDYLKCAGGHELRNFGLVVSRTGGSNYDRDAVTKMY